MKLIIRIATLKLKIILNYYLKMIRKKAEKIKQRLKKIIDTWGCFTQFLASEKWAQRMHIIGFR